MFMKKKNILGNSNDNKNDIWKYVYSKSIWPLPFLVPYDATSERKSDLSLNFQLVIKS